MDPNPYESPRDPEQELRAKNRTRKPQQPAKRSLKRPLGAMAILLLTPLAVFLAAGISCAATYGFVDSAYPSVDVQTIVVVAWTIFLLPPIAVFIGMLWFAFHVLVRTKPSARSGPRAGK